MVGGWRATWYAVVGLLVLFIAFWAGVSYGDRNCEPLFGDCDLGPVFGVIAMVLVLPGWLVFVVLNEARLGAQRRRREREHGRS